MNASKEDMMLVSLCSMIDWITRTEKSAAMPASWGCNEPMVVQNSGTLAKVLIKTFSGLANPTLPSSPYFTF